MPEKLKVAALGCGGIGLLHQQGYLAHPQAELVAVCDLDEAKARSRAQELHVPKWYTSVSDMLKKETIDAVDVVTADDLHYEPVVQCLQAGKHVLCEKPLSLAISEAEAMVAKAEEKGVQLAINYNRRFAPGYAKAREWFEDGACGRLAYIDMKLSQGGPASSRKGQYYLLYELETHAIDLLRWFGGEIVAVCAEMAHPRLKDAREGTQPCWTSMAISVRFDNDSVASLMASWDSDFTHPIERFEICGAAGEIVVDNVISRATLMRRDDQVVEEWRPSIFHLEQLAFNGTFELRVRAFVDDLLAGRPPAPTGRDGLQALRVVEAIVQSWEQKKETEVRRDG